MLIPGIHISFGTKVQLSPYQDKSDKDFVEHRMNPSVKNQIMYLQRNK
jgi:hypothetical protein